MNEIKFIEITTKQDIAKFISGAAIIFLLVVITIQASRD